MVHIGKIGGVNNIKFEESEYNNSDPKNIKLFEFNDEQPPANYSVTGKNKTDWDTSLDKSYSKLGIGSYNWTPIRSTNDAIVKSENNLIDLLRYYEGNAKQNYEAHVPYYVPSNKDKSFKVYGFGLLKGAMTFIGGKYNEQTQQMSNAPKTQQEAYTQMIDYIDKVVVKETKRYLSDDLYNKLPNTVKQALLDYHFKNGLGTMNDNKLKTALEKAVSSNKTEDWVTVLNKLVYNLDGEGNEKAGLHKRSLSRVILATKDIKSIPGIDGDKIDQAVEKIYNDAIECFEKQNADTKECDQIYNNYKDLSITYHLPPEIKSLYGVAIKLCPQKNSDGEDIKDKKTYIIAIINEIATLNGLEYNGEDNGGYPLYTGFKSDIHIPSSITVGNKDIEPDIPKEWGDKSEITETKVQKQENKNHYVPRTKEAPVTTKSDDKIEPPNQKKPDIKTANSKETTDKSSETFERKSFWQSIFDKNTEPQDTKEDNGNENISNITRMFIEFGNENVAFVHETKRGLCIYDFNHKIKSGETLWGFSNKYNVDIETIKAHNELKSNSIRADANIKIPKVLYSTKAEESITSISKDFGIKPEILRAINSLDENVDKLPFGYTLEIPAKIYTVEEKDINKNNDKDVTAIAKKLGVTPSTIVNANSLRPAKNLSNKSEESDKNLNNLSQGLKKGDTLIIPCNNYNISKETGRNPKEYPFYTIQHKDGKVTATKYAWEPTGSGKLNGRTIIINAGHGYFEGGHDPGAISDNCKYTESEITYKNAIALSDKLRAQGAKVIFIQGEVHLAREAIKNETSANMVISIHVNSSKAQIKDDDRFEVYYNSKYPTGKTLAEDIESRLDEKHLDNSDYAQTRDDNHAVTRALAEAGYTKVPTCLVELGFINNPDFQNSVKANPVRDEAINAIYKSVLNYKF